MMKQDLKVTLVQSDLHWEDPQKNLDMFDAKIAAISQTDLIILPEMFNTAFTMNAENLAETMEGKTLSWMRKKAEEKQCVITGSIIIKEENKYFNRLVWMRPEGTFETYDKRHLFRMANEHEHFSSGNKKNIVELKGWKILPLICYDLRFPVWSRNKKSPGGKEQSAMEYDILIYVANWPEKRINAWRTLLMARAIENQCYTIGVNRTGYDDNDNFYPGASVVIDPKGEKISKIDDKESVETVLLSAKELEEFRKSFPVGMDADGFEINL
jgi:omega-amidase